MSINVFCTWTVIIQLRNIPSRGKENIHYKNSFLVDMHLEKYGNKAGRKTQVSYPSTKWWWKRKTRLPLICCNTDIISLFVYTSNVDNVNP